MEISLRFIIAKNYYMTSRDTEQNSIDFHVRHMCRNDVPTMHKSLWDIIALK